jgi:oxygen-independent coproporphyrinogen-3 oxidase
MIKIQQNKRDFEYDIYSLAKAFYSKEEVVTFIGENENLSSESSNATCEGNIETSDSDITVNVEYEETSVLIEISDKNKKIGNTVKINLDNRVEAKNILKHLLYGLLSEFTECKLPWGTLTGIRPTKIPVSLLESGKTRDEVKQYMKDTYLASDIKIDLSIDIAEREIDVLKDIDYKNGYSIYIGIPFCPTTCLYCSFTSYPIAKWANRVDEYLDALCKEIDFTANAFKDKTLNTLYIGGGTPTTLTAAGLERLLTKLETTLDYSNLKELTVEAGRPDSVTLEKFQVMKKHNVTRISINPQTMNQRTLDLIGRKHTIQQIHDAYKMARDAGFDNINMDLIVGLPDEDIEAVRYTMEEIIKLNPDSVTVHSLAIKRAARLNIFKEQYEEMSFVNNSEIIDLTAEYVKKIGAEPYYLYRQKNMTGNLENVGYARAGKEGIYNILIMEEKQTIVAMGAGASSKMVFPDGFRIERIENVKDVENYIERIDEMIERKRSFLESNLL